MAFHICYLLDHASIYEMSSLMTIFQYITIYLHPLWRSCLYYIVCGDDTHDICISCVFMAIVLLCIQDCYMYLQLCVDLYYCTMLIGWLVFHLGSFITPLLGWIYNVFQLLYNPSDLTHYGGICYSGFHHSR